MFSRLLCSLTIVALLTGSSRAGNWPEFRGPTGDGHAVASKLPLEWSETSNVTWKTPIPGRGWSTPVIWGNQIWLTTATEDGKDLSIYCLDRVTGKILFQDATYHVDKPEPLGNPVNGYASPSGVIEEGRVYLHFGSYGTRCIDTKNFKKIWERRDLPCRHYRGPGSSLFMLKDTIIVSMDGVDVQYMVALDKKTGENVWKTDRSVNFNDLDPSGNPKQEGDMRKAYSTPVLATVGGKQHLVSTGSKASYGYDPASGRELWKVTYDGFSNASRPVVAGDVAYVNTGYGKAVLLAVPLKPDSAGDLTKSVLWEQKKRVPLRSSPLVHDGLLYMIADDGQLTALDVKTGEPVWSDRIEGNFSGSPILADGRILMCNEQGVSYWIQPGRELKKLAQAKLETGALASPIAVDHEIYLRTKTHVYRIEQK